MSARQPLYYTFGNHMHWVDMQWLWGYDVLPGSVRDMLRLIRETGAAGNINFDAIGYEKMAAECPEAMEELSRAVADGLIEPVGCSYGQPYGLFHGGESNIRQLTYGVRATRRMLGVRPRAFWEEEFYFFPQLPQLLAQCGYAGACLFFQWTWHTPELPKEPTSLILWEGADGTRLPALPRNDLNVHQWPEDFDGLLDRVADGSWRGKGKSESQSPAVVQWLELMPSRDWMCRSEVLLPRLKELMGDPRFEVRARTLSKLIGELDRGSAPVRRYVMDEVWHGMTLGKNGDRHPRASADAERKIRAAESLSAVLSLFGRPYASWDAYPTWELEEAWRLLLAGQHHDNHECEGLCGAIGHQQIEQARAMAEEAHGRALWLARARTGAKRGVETNICGWGRTESLPHALGLVAKSAWVPPFGYSVRSGPGSKAGERARARKSKGRAVLTRGDFRVEVDLATGELSSIEGAGVSLTGTRLFGLQIGRGVRAKRSVTVSIDKEDAEIVVEHERPGMGKVYIRFKLAEVTNGVDVWVMQPASSGWDGAKLRPGFQGALKTVMDAGWRPGVVVGGPLSVEAVNEGAEGRRKYPSGDWMTAPQWFEDVKGAFNSTSFVDLLDETGERGLLICHEACMQWFREGRKVAGVLTARDAWDEERYEEGPYWGRQLRLIPHGPVKNAERIAAAEAFAARTIWRNSSTSARPVGGGTAPGVNEDLPAVFGPLSVEGAPGVLAHAFFRESMKSGEHLPAWAGHRMFEASGGACDHPFIIRLVEWNGEPAEVELKLAGPVAMAAKTNLLGEVLADRYDPAAHTAAEGFSPADTGWLDIRHPVEPPAWALHGGKPIEFQSRAITWSSVRFRMRPREIATIYADMVMGRKQWRDLDAKRKVWATVHKTPG
ncbi:MAG: hypothetical protein IT436_03680 [Phycisphaerales bacterium]|nr:hypothetical protein [Phycisphaerales bacterium]